MDQFRDSELSDGAYKALTEKTSIKRKEWTDDLGVDTLRGVNIKSDLNIGRIAPDD